MKKIEKFRYPLSNSVWNNELQSDADFENSRNTKLAKSLMIFCRAYEWNSAKCAHFVGLEKIQMSTSISSQTSASIQPRTILKSFKNLRSPKWQCQGPFQQFFRNLLAALQDKVAQRCCTAQLLRYLLFELLSPRIDEVKVGLRSTERGVHAGEVPAAACARAKPCSYIQKFGLARGQDTSQEWKKRFDISLQ